MREGTAVAPVHEMRLEFAQVGMSHDERHANELFVKATRAWVTNPRLHPLSIELLR